MDHLQRDGNAFTDGPAPTPDPRPGDRIGPYEVIESLARGGMATVLAVRDTRTGAKAALKLLLPLQLAEEARSRFRREFRALSRLHHPNVIKVHEWGLHGDRPWFTMEILEGHDLKDHVANLAALPDGARYVQVRSLLRQIAAALEYIHERGLVHRDITPRNLWVRTDGTVTLMDFGVVKEGSADLTTVGEVIGTVAYMAPEQISGESIDARADLYSLGAVLYHLLTGRRPFSAHTLHGFMEKHLNESPRPPREIDPTIPEDLEGICLRLLAKRPADRYASAAHLLHVLGHSTEQDDLEHKWPPRTVGRVPIKARLREAVDALATGGRGAAILITGPAGHGKTRLLELAETWARRRGLTVAGGRCRHHDRPFGAFVGVFRSLAGEDPPPILREVFGVHDDKVWERYQVVSAFRDLVVARAPCAIVVDDLERADPATVELLQYLIRNTLELAGHPVLFVLGHEEPERAVHREITALHAVETQALEPLDAAEVEELVLSVVDSSRASHALAERIHQESRGSPAFIADMLRGLVDDGLIRQQGERFALTLDESEITRSRLPMPASLRQALQERLGPLSADGLEVGRVIALSRRSVDLDVLLAAAPFGEDRVMEAVDELLDAEIVEEFRTDEVERVELSHGRFRDVLLEALPEADRRARHQRMGEVLEREFRGRYGAVVEELAFHFESANIGTKATAYLVQTGMRHLQRSLFDESLVFLDRALRIEPEARPLMLLDDADRQLAEIHLARAHARFNLGQLEDAVESTKVAEELAQLLRDPRLKSRVAAELGMQLRARGEAEAAEKKLRQAISLAEETGEQGLLPSPLYHLGGLLWGRGDLEAAERCWKQSLQIATRIADERAQGYGYNGLAIHAICRGRSMEARNHLEQAATLFERLGMLNPLSIVRVNLVELYLNTGILRKALDLAERTLEQAREVHHLQGVALGLLWRAQARLTIGRADDALSDVVEGLRLIRKLDAREDEVLGLAVQYRVLASQGRLPEALSTLEALLPKLAEFDAEGVAPQIAAWHATTLAALGRSGEAERALAQLRRPAEAWPHVAIRSDLAMGQALRAVGRVEEAVEVLKRALKVAEANGYRYFQLAAHDELCHLALDDASRARHDRVAKALARSLAAGLDRDNARRFLERGWGGPTEPEPVTID